MEKRFASENLPPEIQEVAERMNLDEAQIPPYMVPALESATAEEFLANERPRLMAGFEKYLYGKLPPLCEEMNCDIVEEDANAFGGLATRRELVIRCAQGGHARFLNLLLFLPNQCKGQKVPVFFGLNFKGNHSTTRESGVRFVLPKRYPTLKYGPRQTDNRATVEQRGIDEGRWCFEEVLRRGYAAATLCLWELYPDHPYGFSQSILSLFFDEACFESERRPCGAISAWAWGISRALDALEKQPEIDAGRMAVHGLSRLGKTALWAAANDQRIALAVSNCSGTCGAKLSHRYCGEDFAWIQLWNPHWMMPAFKEYCGRDQEIPVDQNQLIGCIAPRLVFITSASRDEYADPNGEYLGAYHASPYFRFFGKEGLTSGCPPPTGQRVGNGSIGYFRRDGEHNCTPEDWQALLDFTDERWR